MFHAARAALLAVEGSATTNHGGVAKTFKEMVRQRLFKAGRNHAAALHGVLELRIKVHYGDEHLTEVGVRLRDQAGPSGFCGELVAMAGPRGSAPRGSAAAADPASGYVRRARAVAGPPRSGPGRGLHRPCPKPAPPPSDRSCRGRRCTGPRSLITTEHRGAGPEVDHRHLGAEGQFPMCRGELIYVEDLAACGLQTVEALPVPGRRAPLQYQASAPSEGTSPQNGPPPTGMPPPPTTDRIAPSPTLLPQ